MNEFAERLLAAVKDAEDATDNDLMNNKDINWLIRSTMEELGEFCKAVAVEDGAKQRSLDESSIIEAVDCIACSFALYFARGGSIDELPEILLEKLSKYRSKIIRPKVFDADDEE